MNWKLSFNKAIGRSKPIARSPVTSKAIYGDKDATPFSDSFILKGNICQASDEVDITKKRTLVKNAPK
jgi:hypothetical protein